MSTHAELLHPSVGRFRVVPQFDHRHGGRQVENHIHPVHLSGRELINRLFANRGSGLGGRLAAGPWRRVPTPSISRSPSAGRSRAAREACSPGLAWPRGNTAEDWAPCPCPRVRPERVWGNEAEAQARTECRSTARQSAQPRPVGPFPAVSGELSGQAEARWGILSTSVFESPWGVGWVAQISKVSW